jgi:hypothetical protein
VSLRVRSRWKNAGERSLEDIGTVCATNAWRIAGNGVLNLENEGFETTTQRQRLDLIEEFLAFLLHVADHAVYERMSQDERARLITAMAMRMADLVADNRADFEGPGNQRAAFIDRLNQRGDRYAEYRWESERTPGFALMQAFAEWMSEQLGPTNRKWAVDQIMAIEGPEAVEHFLKAMDSLLDPETASTGRRPQRYMSED